MASLMRCIFNGISQYSRCNVQNIIQKPSFLPSLAHSTFLKHYSNAPTPYEIIDPKEEHNQKTAVVSKINEQISRSEHGRLFAVVHVMGKQFKVTEGDLVIIEGYWPPETGDKISLDKVLLAGAAEFTLVGRPVLEKGLVKVEATVIEKSLSHTKTHFRKKRRKQYMRTHFYRIPQTVLRINTVEMAGKVNEPKEVTGLETAIF